MQCEDCLQRSRHMVVPPAPAVRAASVAIEIPIWEMNGHVLPPLYVPVCEQHLGNYRDETRVIELQGA